METVFSCRLDKRVLEFLEKYSAELHTNKGKLLRELVNEGRKMIAIEMYKHGKASIGKAAAIAGMSLSEMIDLLANFKVKSNLDVEDFRESLMNADKLLG